MPPSGQPTASNGNQGTPKKKDDTEPLQKAMQSMNMYDENTVVINVDNPFLNLPAYFLHKVENSVCCITTVQNVEQMYKCNKYKLYFMAQDANDLYQNKLKARIVNGNEIHLTSPMIPSCVKNDVAGFLTETTYPTIAQKKMAEIQQRTIGPIPPSFQDTLASTVTATKVEKLQDQKRTLRLIFSDKNLKVHNTFFNEGMLEDNLIIRKKPNSHLKEGAGQKDAGGKKQCQYVTTHWGYVSVVETDSEVLCSEKSRKKEYEEQEDDELQVFFNSP